MRLSRVVGLAWLALGASGCFKAWDLGGPWACDSGVCAEGYTCDDTVCCKPGGTPECPTLPAPDGTCPSGLPRATYFRDGDRDGAGDPAVSRAFCARPVKEAWVDAGTDCNDADPAVGPLATERCNAQDDDCDGVVDDGLRLQAWFRDTDQDGFGEDCASCVLQACDQPKGYASRAGDCAPQDPARYPGAPERCNHVDDNCNGQLDDPPFVDVENPGTPGPTFDCDTGQLGVCRGGGLQCVFSAVTTKFESTCVPRENPTTDTCSDGKDNDCSGVADDRPGCGGPDALLRAAGVSFGALTFYDAGLPTLPPLPARCMKNVTGSEAMAWVNPSWIGTGSGLHVWYAEAPVGTWWDLSSAMKLRLPFMLSSVGAPPDIWNTPGRFENPIVQLCGDDDTLFQRYTPSAATQHLAATGIIPTPRVLLVPLRPLAGDGWTATNGGLNLAHVRRIEILASPTPVAGVTFTNRFDTDAGVVGFQ